MDRSPPPPDRQLTVTAEALGDAKDDPIRSLVEAHRRVAMRLVGEGAHSRAFGELVSATRAVPMNARLAAYLVQFGIEAAAEPAAIALLQSGVHETDGEVRVAIRRQLARLFRKVREPRRARETLALLLAEAPQDLRARRVFNALLAREWRWDELDASLERSARDEQRRGRLDRAARATLERARIDERRGNHARAALRYQQAAQHLEGSKGGAECAYDLRLLWLRALRDSAAPERAIIDAVQVFLECATKVGKPDRAREAVAALGLSDGSSRTAQGRRQTQQELLRAADEADASGRIPEAIALYDAAVREVPDHVALRKLEATLVARRAWRELAQFYRERAGESAEVTERAEHLTRLAELLEDELQDPEGAAAAWEEIVALTGDADALREQVRLLGAKRDPSAVRRALDTAVDGAPDASARALALVARAEAAVRRGRAPKALADFEAALVIDPASLPAMAGRAELAAKKGEGAAEAVTALVDELRRAPRRFSGRADLLRRAARLAERDGTSAASARWLWSELRTEIPGDEEAEERFLALCRDAGDDVGLEEGLSALIAREHRGARVREARLELVSLMERSDRHDEALAALQTAVRFEQGHREAWLLLAQRLEARGSFEACATALEQAATSTADEHDRAAVWDRLARLARQVLKDEARAGVYEKRASRIREGLAESSAAGMTLLPTLPPPTALQVEEEDDRALTALEMPAVQLPQPVEDEVEEITTGDLLPLPDERPAPAPAPSPPVRTATSEWADWDARPPPPVADEFLAPPPPVRTSPPERERAPAPVPEPVAPWEAPPGELDDGPRTLELPVPLPLSEAPVWPTPSLATPLLKSLRDRRAELLEGVRSEPLEPDAYRRLGDYYEDVGDVARCALMRELCAALEGDPDAAPLAPRLILSATDRAALRHPALRGPEGELLALGGIALCRAFPAKGHEAGTREEFRLDCGRGAASAADALVAAVRILGLPAPDPYLSEDNGPPFSLVFAAPGPKLLVGRLAVKKPLPEAELRFFAGRALFTQSPDLLALRTVRREQLERGLAVLGRMTRGARGLSAEGRAMREGVAPRALPRLEALFASVGATLAVGKLSEAARHSANRAGLVVAGGVAPALAAMRAKRALSSEVVELLKFAASERYLELRTRKLG